MKLTSSHLIASAVGGLAGMLVTLLLVSHEGRETSIGGGESPAVAVATESPPSTVASTPLNAMFALRATCRSHDVVNLHFSTTDEINLVYGENFSISPAVENVSVRHHWWNDTMEVDGDFKPETTYTFTFKAGITSEKGETLLSDSTLVVTTPTLLPTVDFITSYGQMALTPETSIPYRFVACKRATIEVWKAFPSNYLMVGLSRWDDELLEKVTTKEISLPYAKTQEQQALLPVYDLIQGTPGFYRFKIATEETSDECYLLFSNLGATYVYDHQSLPIVAVQSLLDGSAVVGAKVELYDEKYQLMASGLTDAQGLARTQATGTRRQAMPERIIITAGNDCTVIECGASTRHDAYPATQSGLPTFPLYLWPDRDCIRPGESVQVYGLIRTADLKAAAEIPLTLELYSPRHQLVTTASITSNKDGAFTTPLMLPENATTGYYNVLAKVGEETLQKRSLYVNDFSANHVKLELEFPENDPSILALTAKTYFGTPVVKGVGSYALTANYAPFPKAWEGWTVGHDEVPCKLISETFTKDSPDATMVLEGYDATDLTLFSAPLRIDATASFSEPSARAVTVSTALTGAYQPVYLGVRYNDETQSIEMKQLTVDGAPVNAGTIEILSLEEHIHTYKLMEKNGNWRYQWTEYTKDVLPQSALAKGPQPLTDLVLHAPLTGLKPGQYTLCARLNDTVTTSLTFWHQASTVGKRLSHPSNLLFTTDKPTYLAGETALLSFEAPVDGRLIVTLGDITLQKSYAVDVSAGNVRLPITIPASCTHGVWHVGVSLIAKNIQEEARYFGLATLPLNHDAKALHVRLDVPQVIAPNETITLGVNLSDNQGQPARGTLALFAVDEAVLDVTAFETPDPHTALFQDEDSTFIFGDLYGFLLPQLKLNADGRIGGGKAEKIKTVFDDTLTLVSKTAVITLPLHEIDASGTLQIPVTLPDFVGSLRFMAVVANDQKVGATEASVVVRPPVTLTVSGVRYGCAKDVADFTLRVINHDLPSQPYSITMAGQTLCGELATGETRYHTLRLPVTTQTATLTMGEFTTTVTHTITLQEEIPTTSVTTIGCAPQGEALPIGAEALPSLVEVRKVALDWLADYAYRCTEQLSAKMFPYVTSHDEGERALVKQLFALLSSRLSTNGYFSLWDKENTFHLMATLSASHVFIDAHCSGILPATNLQHVLKALSIIANCTEAQFRGEAAYAAFLLGEAGAKAQALHAARNLLVTQQKDIAAFVAAATLVFNGAADEGAPIMKAFLIAQSHPQPLIKGYMDEASAQAMVLLFAKRAGVASADELQQRLGHLLSMPWTSTQANAWAARALALVDDLPQGQLYRQKTTTTLIRDNAPIRVTKRLVNQEGQPITTLAHGALAYVWITFEMPMACDNLVVRDRLPGGLEYEDANLATRESIALPTWAEANAFLPVEEEHLGCERRLFGAASEGTYHVVYPVRATTQGVFEIPAVVIEDLYDINCFGGHDPQEQLTIQ